MRGDYNGTDFLVKSLERLAEKNYLKVLSSEN
jgi:hypothetical protein